VALADVRGHQAQAALMRAALLGDRPGQAYLFAGPDGVGKAFFAVQLAKLLLCEAAGEDACDACKACRQADHDNHPDFLQVQAPEGKRFITIDQIRALRDQYALRPHGQRRVAIIRDADRMQQEAANALLKTLEEPPPWGMLFLTSSRPDSLPDTILSRCQTLRFAPLSTEDVRGVLAAEPQWTPEDVRFAADLADGSLGRARQLLQAGGAALRDGLLSRLRNLRSSHNFEMAAEILARCSESARTTEDQRETLRLVLRLMLRYYRDVWLIQLGAPPQALFHADRSDAVLADARRIAPAAVEQAMELLAACWEHVNRNVNLSLLLENVLFRLGVLVQS